MTSGIAIGSPFQGSIGILSLFPSATLRLHWAAANVAPLGRSMVRKALAEWATTNRNKRRRLRSMAAQPLWSGGMVHWISQRGV